MTSKLSLLLGASGLFLAGCSSPAEGGGDDEGGAPPAPVGNPLGMGMGGATGQIPGATNGGAGQVTPGNGGTGAITPVGQGGTAPVGQGGTAPVGNGEIPIGTGLAITPGADGFVQGMTNGLGIQGAFFAASDGTDPAGMPTTTGTTIEFDAMTTPGSICVSGNISAIAPNPATTGPADAFLWSTYWGAVVGLNLRQVIPPGGAMAQPASPWPRVSPAGTVSGFSYTITANGGTAVPGLRFAVDYVGKPAGATYCSALPAGGGTSASFANVTQDCWNAGGTPLPGSDLLAIQWSILSSETGPVNFDFCLSNVQATVGP